MTAEAPSWLTADFIKKVLRKSYKDESISVENLIIKPATNKGDNFTSEMHRVSVEFTRNRSGAKTRNKISLIVKIAPEGGTHANLIEKSGLFNTEILMMSDTLVEMNRLLGSATPLGARSFYFQTKHPSFIVFEDLAVRGFRMANRETGLDLAHALLAIRGMAKFHATSVALREKHPGTVKKYNKGIFHKDNPAEMHTFFIEGIKALGKEVANWPELGPTYSQKLMKLSTTAYQQACKAAEVNTKEFNVINHGDFWVNNMLFRYDDKGNPIEHIFVDFQLCVYTSPAIDLLYFLNTSLSNELQLTSHDLLLREYESSLGSTMVQLNCETPAPSLEELKRAIRDREIYGMIASFTILPMVLADKSKATSLDEMLGESQEYNNPCYQGEAYRKVMSRMLPHYNRMGLLDL